MRARLLALALLPLACVHQARLYNLNEPGTLIANFKDSGTGSGPIWIGADRKTAECEGEYSTGSEGSTSWGAILTSTGDAAVGTASSVESSQRGAAVMNCKDGRVIECEFVTSASAKGRGACRDNKGGRYRAMF